MKAWWPAGRRGGAIGACIDPRHERGKHRCGVAASKVACPTCGAEAGYRCLTKTGAIADPWHDTRAQAARLEAAALQALAELVAIRIGELLGDLPQ